MVGEVDVGGEIEHIKKMNIEAQNILKELKF